MHARPILPLESWLRQGDGAYSVDQEGEGSTQAAPEQLVEHAGSLWGVCSIWEHVPHMPSKDCGCADPQVTMPPGSRSEGPDLSPCSAQGPSELLFWLRNRRQSFQKFLLSLPEMAAH